jgi:hypothetical protein
MTDDEAVAQAIAARLSPWQPDARRVPDARLGSAGKAPASALSLRDRAMIAVLVSEMRAMLDERDTERHQEVERIAADKVREMLPGLPWGGADPSAQRADMDDSRADRVPTYREQTEQDGS